MSEPAKQMRTCLPPDPEVSRPRFRLPPGATDTYLHIFGPTDRYPLAEKRPYNPPPAPLARLEQVHRILGFERAVFIQPSVYGHDNGYMLDSIATAPERYRGICHMSDHTGDKELEALAAAGVRGAKFNFVRFLGHRPEIDEFRRAVDRAAPLGWHVDLHVVIEDVVELAPVLRGLKVPCVLDHMARWPTERSLDDPDFRLLLELMRDERCWMRLSGADRICPGGPYDAAVPLARALIAAAPDRVIWGSDWPHPNNFEAYRVPNDTDLVNFLADAAPDEGTRRRILVDNPARLYGFV